MDHSNTPSCPSCGAAIPPGATGRLCPACLLSGALAVSGDEGLSAASEEPADGAELIHLPFELGGYRLIGLLGRGGMGTVYEAEELATGRRVALKMLEQKLDSPEMRQRFLREGRLAASVNHPNSLYVFGSEEIEGSPVITMEIAAGGTLKDTLSRRGPLPVSDAVDAILDVINGLEAAHVGGVLHRDVKPSNCFVTPDGSVKVGDFGLSVSTLVKDDSYATASGVVMGTPAYAAPEQLRGDELDLRADIYSVGATLFTLLTGRAPFEGKNAVQVVANAVNQKPCALSELRDGIPPGLERVVARCLSKEPQGRFDDYMALRNALLPFSTREAQPASLTVRASAGWIDYLVAFMTPYVPLMLLAGGEEFHARFFVEPSLSAARYYLVFLIFGLLYFSLVEGIWGAGLGKRLKRLRVVRTDGRSPGMGRALVRILIPILCCEGIRIPLLLAMISANRIDEMTTADVVLFFVASCGCPWIPVLLSWGARRENGFATLWDRLSGTRVVIEAQGRVRPAIEPVSALGTPLEWVEAMGPFEVSGEVIPGAWLVASDPVLRRQVWLLRRGAPGLAPAREDVARRGRLRWLQEVNADGIPWDAFEASRGIPFAKLVEKGRQLPWSRLRHWLHDLATELWMASGDRTLPAELSLDHIWIDARGDALLLDEPWPGVEVPAERFVSDDFADQQRCLSAVADCVEPTGLPLHARPVLRNLAQGRFEKLSFLTGTLRGFQDRPVEVGRGVRAGAIFMLPAYIWILVFVGCYKGDGRAVEALGETVAELAMSTILLVLAGSALVQLLALPLRTTTGHATFRLAVINAAGEPARVPRLLLRWAIAWLPLFVPLALIVGLLGSVEGAAAFGSVLVLLLLWLGAALRAICHPSRGWHDHLAGTWVVRR